jgi:hypothetical protein
VWSEFQRLQLEIGRRRIALDRLIAEGEGPLRVPYRASAGPASWWVFVHPSTRTPGAWQATRFDGDEPFGDTESASWAALLRHVHWDGLDWTRAERVTKASARCAPKETA